MADMNKYRWHNLMEEPNCLPRNEMVIVAIKCRYGYIYSSAIWGGFRWLVSNDDDKFGDVVAWKYIEPFEGESQEVRDMTVAELIGLLKELQQDAQISYDYGLPINIIQTDDGYTIT